MARPLPILNDTFTPDINHLDSVRTYIEHATNGDPTHSIDWETYYTISRYCQDPESLKIVEEVLKSRLSVSGAYSQKANTNLGVDALKLIDSGVQALILVQALPPSSLITFIDALKALPNATEPPTAPIPAVQAFNPYLIPYTGAGHGVSQTSQYIFQPSQHLGISSMPFHLQPNSHPYGPGTASQSQSIAYPPAPFQQYVQPYPQSHPYPFQPIQPYANFPFQPFPPSQPIPPSQPVSPPQPFFLPPQPFVPQLHPFPQPPPETPHPPHSTHSTHFETLQTHLLSIAELSKSQADTKAAEESEKYKWELWCSLYGKPGGDIGWRGLPVPCEPEWGLWGIVSGIKADEWWKLPEEGERKD